MSIDNRNNLLKRKLRLGESEGLLRLGLVLTICGRAYPSSPACLTVANLEMIPVLRKHHYYEDKEFWQEESGV